MTYLMIESKGEADSRAFTVFGMSTSRGDDSLIGQFGSGSKHGITLLLRKGYKPHVYCGRKRLQFSTRKEVMSGQEFNRVVCQEDQKTPKLMDWDLSYGDQDWTKTGHALREFISNAIDAVGHDNVHLEVVEKPRAKAGYTRIFVEYTEAVQAYYENLDRFFLHWGEHKDKTFIPTQGEEQARIYRKGVYVCTMGSWNKPSMFHYNLGEELPIDESRNLNEWEAKSAAAKALANSQDGIEAYCQAIKSNKNVWELTFPKYHMEGNKETWQKAWTKVFGDTVVADNNTKMVQLQSKGITAIRAPKDEVFEILNQAGIKTGNDKLTPLESMGGKVKRATPDVISTFDAVWNWLTEIEMINGKNKPEYWCFTKVDEGIHLFGYQEDNKVYLNVDDARNYYAALHELSHYITDAEDLTPTFQEYAFNVATRMGELLFT